MFINCIYGVDHVLHVGMVPYFKLTQRTHCHFHQDLQNMKPNDDVGAADVPSTPAQASSVTLTHFSLHILWVYLYIYSVCYIHCMHVYVS